MIRILVGGDVKHTLDPADSILQRQGWEVVRAATPLAISNALRELSPSIVVLDVADATLDAIACCRSIKADPATSSVPVVFVSTPPEQLRCAGAGGDGFLSRPLTLARLLEALRRWVEVEERTGERIPLGLKADWRSGSREGLGIIRDLGPDGLFLQTREVFEFGTAIELSFALPVPGAHPLRIGGIVTRIGTPDSHHHRLPGVGIRFRVLPAADKLEIARFLRERRESGA